MSENITVNPLKLSQPAGAALAFMGIKGSIPLWHGVQGCTAFGKILFIQHFREPIPFQTTALSHLGVVMGGDDNVAEAVDKLKDDAGFIGILTTGVTETCGVDVGRLLKEIRQKNPALKIAAVNTPDYEGSLETGWVRACNETLKSLTKARSAPRRKQVAIFTGPYLTPGEVEELKVMTEAFGLRPVLFPDLGDSLYGYLSGDDFSPCSIGGTPVEEIETLADSALVISVGRSMAATAGAFAEKHGLEAFHYDHLASLDEIDHFFKTLQQMSGLPVPERYRKMRRHLQDTFLDTHFYFHSKRVALAGDPDFIIRWKGPMEAMGIPVSIVSALSFEDYPVGDLSQVASLVDRDNVDLLIGNSHLAELAEEKGIAALRCGLPVYDRLGEPQMVRIGYAGAARLYRECANALMAREGKSEVGAYVSPLQAGL